MLTFSDCDTLVKTLDAYVEKEGFSYRSNTVSGQTENRTCFEVLGFSCKLTHWKYRDMVREKLGEANWNFLKAEFQEWINPNARAGKACEEDPETWDKFRTENGHFSYTYTERFHLIDNGQERGQQQTDQFSNAIEALKKDPNTRQAFIGIWSPYFDSRAINLEGPDGRVPCTIGYHLLIRDGKLYMIYIMRSLCVSWNLWNDLYLVTNLYDYLLSRLQNEGVEVSFGDITLQVGSLHKFL